MIKEVIQALKSYDIPILKSYVTQRIIYPTVIASGETVYISGYNEAQREIDSIRDEIIGFLK